MAAEWEDATFYEKPYEARRGSTEDGAPRKRGVEVCEW